MGKILDFPQGSEAWLMHRRTSFNASDAPAMMGVSPYKTRNQLLHEMHTGLTAEVDTGTQKLFDEGHRVEALLRPIAEEIIGDDLYPVTVAEGRISASLDGTTLEGKINFEAKMLNATLRDYFYAAAARTGNDGNINGFDLPAVYRVQMEQQMHCNGAEKTLFMTGKFYENGTAEEVWHCWYYPDMKLRAEILAGWDQFEKDLSVYTPTAAVEPVRAAAQESLPAVSVRMDGSLAVHSNLPLFGEALKAFIAKIPAKPSTDQEFADTEAACKSLKRAEEALEAAENNALASMADVEAMRRMVADFRTLARTARLASDKMVAARKQQIREEEVRRGHSAVSEHLATLNRELGGAYVNGLTRGDFAGCIKGLKTMDSLRNAIDTEIAAAKAEANQKSLRIAENLRTIEATGMPALFSDRRELVLKDPEAVLAIAAQRVAEHQAAEQRRLDAERERIRQEELARIERERVAAEAAKAKAEREAEEAEQRRIAAEHAQLERERIAHLMAGTPKMEGETPVLTTQGVATECTDGSQSQAASLPADAAVVEPVAEGVAAPDDATGRDVLTEPLTQPTLKGGDICDRLGFTLQAVFIAQTLGIPWSATAGSAKLWHESDFALIKAALIKHIEAAK